MEPGERRRRRPTWDELPSSLRAGLQDALGAPVVEAVSQPRGLTLGLASRVRLADGRRAFVKAAGAHRGTAEVERLRREAWITGSLPAAAPAPAVLASHDDGRWVAVAFADVDGVPPALPWRTRELTRVLDAVTDLAALVTPSPVPVPTFVREWADDLTGWRAIAGTPGAVPADLDPWAVRRLDRLASIEADWPAAAAGETLLHGDLRADNILLAPDGVVFVDWPGACVGARWLDLVFLLPSVTLGGGPSPELLAARHPLTLGADPDALTAVIAAMAGFLVLVSREPAPWYAPEIREFQAGQAAVALGWLRRRLG